MKFLLSLNKHIKLVCLVSFLVLIAFIAYAVSYRTNFSKNVLQAYNRNSGLNLLRIVSQTQKMLPKGTEFEKMKRNLHAKPLLQGDMDGDGINELAAIYKNKKGLQHGVCVLKLKNGNWKRIFEYNQLGRIIDWTSFEDMNGDGNVELLVGSGNSTSQNFELHVLGCLGSSVSVIAKIEYHTLQVEDMPGEVGKDGAAEVAVGLKDGSLDVLKLWNFGQFIPAEEERFYYFTKQLPRLEKKMTGHPDASDLYLLAEARFYAKKYDECILTIDEALSLNIDDKELRNKLLLLKAKVHFKKRECLNSEQILRDLLNEQTESKLKNDFYAQCLLELGNCLGAAGNYDAAREAYSNANEMYAALFINDDFKKLAGQLFVREAANKLETGIVSDMLAKWLAEKRQAKLTALAEQLVIWGAEHNLNINSITPEKSKVSGDFLIISMDTAVPDKNITGSVKAFAFLWREGENIASQMIYTGYNCEYTNKVLSFRLDKGTDGAAEAGVIFNDSNRNYTCPVFKLFRYKDGSWNLVWTSPVADWRNDDGSITFVGEGISEFILKSSSFCYKDEKSSIFLENRAGPHRWFIDTWVRQGDGYTVKSAQTIPSAYNTLTEFIYSLSIDNKKAAVGLAAHEKLVRRAEKLGLVQNLPGSEWTIEMKNTDNEITGPLTIVVSPGPAKFQKKIEVTFVNRDGQYLISAILPLK